jgi:Pyruvate/2-oxoacid:ferredoxin oxidoreductase delta subunit
MPIKSKIPIINVEKCTNCDKCIEICPTDAICKSNNYTCSKCIKYCLTMDVPCNPDHKVFCYEKCDSCGICVTSCPVNAITWFTIQQMKE